MRRASILPVLVGAVLLAGCVPTAFNDLRQEATTVALAPPGDYPRPSFGQVVAGWGGTLSGTFVSRIGGTGGPDTPYDVFELVRGDVVDLEGSYMVGCDDGAPCAASADTAMAGFPRWGAREMCFAVTAPSTGEVQVRCETEMRSREVISGPTGMDFGFSAAGLSRTHPFGVAIFGAPGAASQRGSVYRLPDGGSPIEIDLSEGYGTGSEIGRAVAVGAIDDASVLIAAGASAAFAPVRRVIVAVSTVAMDGSVTTRVHACLDDTADEWGSSLAIGDLTGDGILDVAASSGTGDVGDRLSTVRVYDGATLPAAGSCAAWAPSIELECPDTPDGVSCARESQFGATLAIGDLDGDGAGELLVGAPEAAVDDVTAAGAVFVFRGAASLTNLDAEVTVLRHSTPTTGASLGTALAVSPGLDDAGVRRDEPVVGAPGANRVYVFLCSGLDGDSPSTTAGMRCQPRDP